jgi:hypothetical protein
MKINRNLIKMEYLLISGLIFIGPTCGDAIQKLQEFIPNRAPVITKFNSDSPGKNALLPNLQISVIVEAHDPDYNPLEYEFISDIGSFANQRKTGKGARVTYILPAAFSPELEVKIRVKVTDSKKMSASKSLDIGSGKTGAIIIQEEEINMFLTTDGKRTIRWQADSEGYYQVRILGVMDECKSDIDIPFINYSEYEWMETTFHGPDYPGALENILQIGQNQVCIIVKDFLKQDGILNSVLIVDPDSPITTTSPSPNTYSSAQNVILNCEDLGGAGPGTLSQSGCDKIIYTVSADGSVPDDPDFSNDGNIKVGQLFSSPIYAENGKVTKIKFRSSDIAGNIEDVKMTSFVIDENPTVITIVSNEWDELSDGIVAYASSSSLTWNANSIDQYFMVKIGGSDCDSGKISTGTNAIGFTTGGDIISAILASDLSYNGNIIRICVEVFMGGYVYEEYSIIRREEVAFSMDSSGAGEEPTSVDIYVSLTAPLDKDVSVYYDVPPGGSATVNEDYNISGFSPFEILAGDTIKSFTITPIHDLEIEGDETIELILSNALNADVGSQNNHTFTIFDNDDPPAVSFETNIQRSAYESGSLTVKIIMSHIYYLDVNVPFSLSGSANQGEDYNILTASPVTIPDGTISGNIIISITEDTDNEGDEDIIIDLEDPVNGILDQGPSAYLQHTAIIENDDENCVFAVKLPCKTSVPPVKLR